MARPRRKNFKQRIEKPRFRINQYIRIPEIRLVGDNFEEISNAAGRKLEPGVYRTRDAQDWAMAMDLDLVEISPKADPPVCRIIDYKKFLYQKKKKEKEIKAKAVKTVIKEIRFGPNTDDHDFDFKLRHAKKFLEEGSKVKAYVHFRGRTIVFKDRGQLLLLKFLKELEDYGAAEALPKMEGRRMIVVVAPHKTKKKPKKKEAVE
ncbi:MAG: translation initiation factor IF-3 [Saprospiraceae bacterium]|nr:translation initiation factor IF-3 [Saprospiraceae bacterium]